LMFGMYDWYRNMLGCRHLRRDHGISSDERRHVFTWCHGLAAFLSGVTEASLTPFERVQTLMQSSKYHTEFKNSWEALRYGLRPYGIREYYRGLSVILMRNGSTNVIFFALKPHLLTALIGGDRRAAKELSANRRILADFLTGGLLGVSLSTIVFPLNVVKARMQNHLGGEFQKPLDVLATILKERESNVRELYRGLPLNICRSFLTWGFTNAGYELLQRMVFGKGSE